MGNETILYYVTQDMITNVTDNERCKKRRFGRKMRLPSFIVESGAAEITVIAVMIPPLKKCRKVEKLLKLMREAAESYRVRFPDMDILLHPQVERMLDRNEGQDVLPAVYWSLAEKLLAKIFDGGGRHGRYGGVRPGSVVLLLGDFLFPEEQMRRFMAWMMPYFPYVNRLFVLYDAAELSAAGTAMETEGEAERQSDRFEEVIRQEAETLFYEYGLVSQIQCGKGAGLKRRMAESGQSPIFFLDFGYAGGIPFRALKQGDVYLDLFSDEKKEALFRRKYMEISYVSVRKYLDTLVKSGYDK